MKAVTYCFRLLFSLTTTVRTNLVNFDLYKVAETSFIIANIVIIRVELYIAEKNSTLT